MCFNNFSSMNSTRGFWTAPTWAKIICLKKVGGVLETYFHCLLNGFKQNIIKGYFLLLNQGLIHLWLKLLESFLFWNFLLCLLSPNLARTLKKKLISASFNMFRTKNMISIRLFVSKFCAFGIWSIYLICFTVLLVSY